MMTALSFILINNVEQAFIDLMDTNYSFTNEETKIHVINYFENNLMCNFFSILNKLKEFKTES